MEEINGLKMLQDLDNKRKHIPGTNSISSKGHIEMTNATKGIIERIAEDLLNDKTDDIGIGNTFVPELAPIRSYKNLRKKNLEEENR